MFKQVTIHVAFLKPTVIEFMLYLTNFAIFFVIAEISTAIMQNLAGIEFTRKRSFLTKNDTKTNNHTHF